MKKIILFSSTFVLATTIAFAQFSGGLKGGLNMSTFTGDNTGDYKYNFGFHVGGFGNYAFSDMLSFQGELLYSTKGAAYHSSNPFYTLDETITPSYLDIPLLLQVKPGGGLFIQGGPQIGFLLGVNSKVTTTTGSTSSSSTSSSTDGWNTTDIALALGLGFQAESGFQVGLRANIGLSNINNNSSSSSSTAVNHNMVFQLSLGYAFGGGGGGHHGRRR